ncbi:hypothetical protein [Deinococcus hohokamensis]|uniref:Peptide chain release factor 1 n=1 Tax=Deinococcus hohokamensis TaxID=309883 RepID=A0ABV9IDK0_9DEIO
MTDAGPDDMRELDDLPALLERYATLRDTLQGLEAERDALAAQIKAALLSGQDAETDLYRATLKVSRRVEYPLDRFREAFGDAAALEVASVDRKKAEALAKAGDLDPERLRDLAVVREVQALVLQPKTI